MCIETPPGPRCIRELQQQERKAAALIIVAIQQVLDPCQSLSIKNPALAHLPSQNAGEEKKRKKALVSQQRNIEEQRKSTQQKSSQITPC